MWIDYELSSIVGEINFQEFVGHNCSVVQFFFATKLIKCHDIVIITFILIHL